MTRHRLPNRRASETLVLVFRGLEYAVSYSRFSDGRVAEIFLDAPTKGLTPLADDARDVAVAISIALQHGASVDELRSALSRTSAGEPIGIGGAALDLIAGEGR